MVQDGEGVTDIKFKEMTGCFSEGLEIMKGKEDLKSNAVMNQSLN